ncbi:nodulation protein NfeD [Orrella sp. JC864]|uniref:NfeD family protein n=1 Tax=Orrella sp. JC864 TaxID=3120298 RepID=UPI0014293FA8
MIRALLCVLAGLLGALALPGPAAAGQAARPVVLLEVQGPIGPATTHYLRRGLEAAARLEAAAAVIRIDTPGGLVSSTREIVQHMLASPVPVIAYVAPGGAQAASAGTYLVYASHVAAMAPGTNIGAATPVQLGPGPSPGQRRPTAPGQPDTAPPAGEPGETGRDEGGGDGPDAGARKAINDAVAFIRSLADLHGRNAQWAESAVREGASIAARQALEQDVVDIVAPTVEELLRQADGRQAAVGGLAVTLATAGAELVTVAPDWRTRFLAVITNPNIAYVLMLLGIYGIIFELMSPGAIFPGVLGGVALVTALFALNLLPVSYAGVGLLMLGIALMAAEAFTPTLGLLGIAGAVIFGLGSLFMFDGDHPAFVLSLPVIVTATAVMAALLGIMLAAALRAHRRKAESGGNALVGHTGQVLSWSNGTGRVQVNGESWQARAPGPLPAGERVRVLAREGLTLTVAPERPIQQEKEP